MSCVLNISFQPSCLLKKRQEYINLKTKIYEIAFVALRVLANFILSAGVGFLVVNFNVTSLQYLFRIKNRFFSTLSNINSLFKLNVLFSFNRVFSASLTGLKFIERAVLAPIFDTIQINFILQVLILKRLLKKCIQVINPKYSFIIDSLYMRIFRVVFCSLSFAIICSNMWTFSALETCSNIFLGIIFGNPQ
jgi:hypothetical protein